MKRLETRDGHRPMDLPAAPAGRPLARRSAGIHLATGVPAALARRSPPRPGFQAARLLAIVGLGLTVGAADPDAFEGRHFSGRGDREYFQLLESARDMFEPTARHPNVTLLYATNWNGLVEGPTWDAWWIQNSYGTTYSILPLLQEPFVTFLQNSQDLWFDQMGDGKRVGATPPFDWVAPDGALCDAARPGWIVYKQGDGRTALHDWGMEFTAAGMVMQGELLLQVLYPG